MMNKRFYMNSTISVIIPVHNVERYLPQCLDSVLSQSCTDLQVILIDDGSTDSCGVICDEYAEKDARVEVIHQKNAGAAAAKNAGLRVATGKYLSFVDSDDYLAPDAYAHMVELLEAQEADVVQCAFNDVYVDKVVAHSIQGEQTEFTTTQYLEQFTKDWTCGLLWDKLYRRRIFQDIYFEEGHRIDDEYFTYRGIMNASKILCDDRIVYNYRKRRSSVMYSPESAQRILLDRIDYTEKRRKHIIHRFPELRRHFDLHFLNAMILYSRDPDHSMESAQTIREELKSYFREKNHTPPPPALWLPLLKLWTKTDCPPGKTTSASSPPAQNVFFD